MTAKALEKPSARQRTHVVMVMCCAITLKRRSSCEEIKGRWFGTSRGCGDDP